MMEYPNLELLEYKVSEQLASNKSFFKRYRDKRDELNVRSFMMDFECTMFPQIWGSTCTGFDVTEDGTPVISGCAMTKEYTSVFHELMTDIYVVCFGDRVCYIVDSPNEIFFDDLKNRNMVSLSKKKKYESKKRLLTKEEIQEKYEYGDVMPISEFLDCFMYGVFSAYDGYGVYFDDVTEEEGEVLIMKKDIIEKMLDKYRFVIWYNK